MGIENPVHLLFIAVVALLVLGPKRLPEVARTLGKGLREFRAAVDGSMANSDHGTQGAHGAAQLGAAPLPSPQTPPPGAAVPPVDAARAAAAPAQPPGPAPPAAPGPEHPESPPGGPADG